MGEDCKSKNRKTNGMEREREREREKEGDVNLEAAGRKARPVFCSAGI